MRESHFIPEIQEAPFRAPAPVDLRAALEHFYLPRQALRRTPATMEHYKYTAGHFVRNWRACSPIMQVLWWVYGPRGSKLRADRFA